MKKGARKKAIENKKEHKVVKRRVERAHRELMKVFMKSPVTNIKFSGNRVSFNFYGHKISDRICVKKQPHVGEWSRRIGKIVIDRYFNEKDKIKEFRSLCIHEAVERFLVKTYGLNTDNEAHPVAKKKEREYLESVKGNWKGHELRVYWDWHKQGEK
ncbi:Uncharacterised protein [uncultured archaeon]|nr:Uncharacterised protein [uncultured archaeon]